MVAHAYLSFCLESSIVLPILYTWLRYSLYTWLRYSLYTWLRYNLYT
jgi:hypothetical protein